MFYEINFPESISIKSTAMIEFNTSVVTSKNGKEQRINSRNEGRMIFNIASGIKSRKDLEQIISFFRIVKGRSGGFRFKDWLDFKVINQIIGYGDGKEKSFQLIKIYNITNNNSDVYVRKITKPVTNTVKIFIKGEEVDNSTFEIKNGIINFQTPPQENAIVSANFEFDVPVRFESDILELGLDTQNAGIIKDIKLVEILQ